jgi:hypothetical protein
VADLIRKGSSPNPLQTLIQIGYKAILKDLVNLSVPGPDAPDIANRPLAEPNRELRHSKDRLSSGLGQAQVGFRVLLEVEKSLV